MSFCGFQLSWKEGLFYSPSICDVLHHRPDGNSIHIVVAPFTSLKTVDMCHS